MDLTAVILPAAWSAVGWAFAVALLPVHFFVYIFVATFFGEATLTGMVLTLAVAYRSQWVATFDDARYLEGR